MIDAVRELNAERASGGEPPMGASIGLHCGPAVLGDIGVNRLEFAVIGNTVNVASRVEAMSRALSAQLVVTDEFLQQAVRQAKDDQWIAAGLDRQDEQEIRGLDARITLWTIARDASEPGQAP